MQLSARPERAQPVPQHHRGQLLSACTHHAITVYICCKIGEVKADSARYLLVITSVGVHNNEVVD